MRNGRHVVTVFGSAVPAAGTSEYQVAYELGILLARSGFGVCNGGYGGTMEGSAQGAHDGGGTCIGVTTRYYSRSSNPWITEVVETETPVERLLRLVDEGDGYVFLPGGTGTLLELAAVWEFMNKGITPRRPAVLLGDFWSEVVSTVKGGLEREGRTGSGDFIARANTPEECVRILSTVLKVK